MRVPGRAGPDPRMMASVKLQLEGERRIAMVSIHDLALYLAKEQGRVVNYAAVSAFWKGLTQARLADLAAGGVKVYHGLLEPHSPLITPAGYLVMESVF